MLSREEILAILRPITEPITGQSLVDIRWIRDIMMKEGKVSLTVALLDMDEVMKEEISDEISYRLLASGIEDIHIRFRQASVHEQEQAGIILTESELIAEEQVLQGHGLGLENLSIFDEATNVKFIAIASGKGGVGKSTVTANLATALTRRGYSVGVIDADIYGFSIPAMMGISDSPMIDNGIIIPVEHRGVKVMSMSFFIKDNNPVIWRGPMLGKMVRQFISEVSWGQIDYMLIDMPPGTGDIALDVHQMFPNSQEIIVTTPHATASQVAERAGTMALQTEHKIIGVVENMAYYQCKNCDDKEFIFGQGGGEALANSLNTTLLAQIPIHPPENLMNTANDRLERLEQIYNDLAQKVVTLW